MKVIIQIPCYNEESALPVSLARLPKRIEGVDEVEWLIIDDGSTDRTVDVAKSMGVHHIIQHSRNLGLARAFMTGLDACLRAGADIIVNTDADNQYNAEDIDKLVLPILNNEAQIVIGARPIPSMKQFSVLKKCLQRLGSWVVRVASGTHVEDAPSGFRAISRDAAKRLNVFSDYTYTLETIIQAGQKGISIISVPIRTNEDLRPSRLVKSIPSYIRKSIITIVRIFMTYQPFKFFAYPGAALFFLGLLLGFRFLYFYMTGGGEGHIQSVVLAALLMSLGGMLVLIGMVADLIGVNRKLLEKIEMRVFDLEEKIEKHEKVE